MEIGTGNWSRRAHIDLDELLGSKRPGSAGWTQLRRRNIALCALNCSGNPLAFQKDWEVTEKTFRLAKLLGVEKIVMMSGLPAGCPGDKTPFGSPPVGRRRLRTFWITSGTRWPSPSGRSWSVWRRTAASVRSRWKTMDAAENNPETLFRLRGSPLAPWWA